MTDKQKILQIEISNIVDKMTNGLMHPITGKQMLYESSIKALTIPDVVSTCCDKVPSDSYYLGTTCLKCNKPFRQINK